MKKIIISTIATLAISTSAFAGGTFSTTEDKSIDLENKRLCSTFTAKIVKYELNMRDDSYAVKTLEHYQNQKIKHCSQYRSQS